MGVQGTRLNFDIVSRHTGDGLRDLERDARKADDALDDLDGTTQRLDSSSAQGLRTLQAQKAALAGQADEAGRAKRAIANLGGGRDGHSIGVRIGASIARGISTALIDGSGMIGRALTSIPPQAQATIVAGIAAMAIPIGAALNGVILAGLGTAVVGAGVAIAAQSSKVKAAGEMLGLQLLAGLKRSADAFVPATLQAIGMVRNAFAQMGPDLERLFSAAAPHLLTLTAGVTEFAQSALPGMAKAMSDSGPVMESFRQGLQTTGQTLGDTLQRMATQSPGAAKGLNDFFIALNVSLAGTGAMVTGLSFLYDKLRFLAPAWLLATDAAMGHNRAIWVSTPPLLNYTSGIQKAAANLDMLSIKQREAADSAGGLFAAHTRLREAILQSTQAKFRNSAGITKNTAQANDNRNMLQRLRDATIAEADAAKEAGRSQATVNSIMRTGYNAFIAAAGAMNISKKRAHELAVQLGLIPKETKPKVTALTAEAQARIKALQARLNAIHSKSVHVSFTHNVNRIESVYRRLTRDPRLLEGRASGGPVRRGRSYVVGEKGPEVVTMTGNGQVIPADKSRRMMAGNGGSPAGVAAVHLTIDTGGSRADEAILELLRRSIRIRGGNVQIVLGQ